MEQYRLLIFDAQFHQNLPKLIQLFINQKAKTLTKEELQHYYVNICQRTCNEDFDIKVSNSILPKLIKYLINNK